VLYEADEIAAQSPSTPSVSGPHPPIAAQPHATPASGPSVPPGSENRVPVQQAKNDMEQGKVTGDFMENLGLSITEIVSGATIEPLLHSESSECLPPLT